MARLPSCRPQLGHSLLVGCFFVAAALLPSSLPAQPLPAPPTPKAGYIGALTVHPSNRRYFMSAASGTCTALYLAGTQHRANVQDIGTTYPPPAFDFATTYPPADAPHANFIRGFHHEHSRWDFNSSPSSWVLPLPFSRTGPGTAHDGKARFNLTQYDGSYISRLQSRATTAASDGMYMSLMLFNGFSVENRAQGEFTYPNHPFGSQNNVNGINGDWTTTYPDGAELHTAIASKPAAVTNAQDNYVRQIVQSLNGARNILWEVANEGQAASLPWQEHIASMIRNQEATLTYRHLIWMTHPRGVSNVALYNSTADVVSPGVNEMAVTATGATLSGTAYQTDPPVTSGAKIFILETDHLQAACDWCSRAWVWKAFTRGYHVSLLDDINDANNAKRQQVRDAIDDTVAYSQKIRLLDMSPQSESGATVCSSRYCLYTSDDPDPQPYAAAVPNGNEYLVFKPTTTPATDQVTIYNLPADSYGGEWFNVATGAVTSVTLTHSGGDRILTSPYGTAESVLWLKRSNVLYLCSK